DFISSLYRKLQVRVPRKSIDYHDEVLKSLKMIDLERREEIASLISLIKDKISFKNISEFSAYLNNRGVYERKISSWQEGIFRLVKFIENDNFSNEIIMQVKKDLELKSSSDRSLERWSEIIFHKDLPPK
ncbi:hypothetical protein, partial [Vibrio cholerae]|uniref:hypothetical protein n=1 Tax=Vibrio cholerae TaxID=666 RepID=UPI00163D32CB